MRQIAVFFLVAFGLLIVAAAQTPDTRSAPPPAEPSAAASQAQPGENAARAEHQSRHVTLPAGTRVLLQLQSPIYTKTARVGDGVYCESTFPVTQENQLAIPAGTYVKGTIARIQRPGRIKGRAELQLYFTTMIFPNGYTVDLPGALDSTPGSEDHRVSDNEGTVKSEGTKGRDVGTVASTTTTGAAIGALSAQSGKGAAIGSGIGAAAGLAMVLLTRGPDVRLDRGTSVEMVLQRPLTVEVTEDYQRPVDFRTLPRPERRLERDHRH